MHGHEGRCDGEVRGLESKQVVETKPGVKVCWVEGGGPGVRLRRFREVLFQGRDSHLVAEICKKFEEKTALQSV